MEKIRKLSENPRVNYLKNFIFMLYMNEMKLVRQKLEFLEREIQALKEERERIMPDSDALALLKEEILKSKAEGISFVDVVYLHNRTHLPSEQLARLMEVLEKEGFVHPDE